MVHTYVTKLPNGDFLRVHTRDEDEQVIVREIFGDRIYDKYYSIKEGDRVVDVGANIGCFTLKACKAVGERGHVTSIEPTSQSSELLRKNIKLNNYADRCSIFTVAAGSDNSNSEIKLYKNRAGEHSLVGHPGREVTGVENIQIRTLDSITSDHSLKGCNFLKIDVEGFELEVLKGAKELLKDFHPHIAMETHSFGPSPKEIESFLTGFGYSPRIEPYGKIVGLLYA